MTQWNVSINRRMQKARNLERLFDKQLNALNALLASGKCGHNISPQCTMPKMTNNTKEALY